MRGLQGDGEVHVRRPEVQRALTDFVLLQADVTANDDADQALMQRFDVRAARDAVLRTDGTEKRALRLIGFEDAGSSSRASPSVALSDFQPHNLLILGVAVGGALPLARRRLAAAAAAPPPAIGGAKIGDAAPT